MTPDEATAGEESAPVFRTLADKVNWLIDRAHPAGRGPFSNNEVAALIKDVTGEEVSYTTIWKLRNGQAQNPQKRLIEALARTFGVPPAFSLMTTTNRPGCCKSRWNYCPWSGMRRLPALSSAPFSSSVRRPGRRSPTWSRPPRATIRVGTAAIATRPAELSTAGMRDYK